jgi:hypothetical protein
VNTYTTGSQGLPDVAVLAGGGTVIAFTSDETPPGIRARLFDRALVPQGPEFRVQTSAMNATWPQVAADPGGGFVVAWQGSDDGSSVGAFARRFDPRGAPLGDEFRVNTYTTDIQGEPGVTVSPAGLVVVWSSRGQDGSSYGVIGRRYDREGGPLGGEFRVNTYTIDQQRQPRVDSDRLGNLRVVWSSRGQDGSSTGIFAQRFDSGGVPQGGEFQVNVATTGYQAGPDVESDQNGNFVVSWATATGVFARRFDAQGVPREGEFLVNSFAVSGQLGPELASDRHGNFMATWTDTPAFDVFARRFGWLLPSSAGADRAAGAGSDGNDVFEPCETVAMEPAWRNFNGSPLTFAGSASFTGPPGAAYEVADATAAYGPLSNGDEGTCLATADCYALSIPCPAARPAPHWDATLVEDITPVAMGQSAAWPVHVGESFPDVPRTSLHYRFVETLLHGGVTAGCGDGQYCPAQDTARYQMAVFVLAGRQGPAWRPPPCGATPRFADVPPDSPFCAWIEELARRGVVAGCGNGLFCPGDGVTREQMAVFVLKTLDPGLEPAACAAPVFSDVPADSMFCRWIEELARRGVVAGCAPGRYCPTDPVARDQMAVFITGTFGLSLYGP